MSIPLHGPGDIWQQGAGEGCAAGYVEQQLQDGTGLNWTCILESDFKLIQSGQMTPIQAIANAHSLAELAQQELTQQVISGIIATQPAPAPQSPAMTLPAPVVPVAPPAPAAHAAAVVAVQQTVANIAAVAIALPASHPAHSWLSSFFSFLASAGKTAVPIAAALVAANNPKYAPMIGAALEASQQLTPPAP